MAVVKYDVSDEDLDSVTGGYYDGEPPQPGVYMAKVVEINPGFSKDDDGEPDESRPRLEVVYEITGNKEGGDSDFAGARLWDYVSFSKAAGWKLAQFLKALGEVDSSRKKGSFDTEKYEGSPVKLRVKKGTYNGEYSPNVGTVWPPDQESASSGSTPDDGLEEDEEEEIDVDSLTEDDIMDMKVAELREVASAADISLSGMRKAEAQEHILEELGLAEEDDEEVFEEEEEVFEDDFDFDDEEEEDDDFLTEEDVENMGKKELKELADELGVSLSGMTKSQAVSALKEELGLDEVPF